MTRPQLPPDPEYDAKYGSTPHFNSAPPSQTSVASGCLSMGLGLVGLVLMLPGAACVVTGFGGVLRGQFDAIGIGVIGLVVVAIGMALWRMARRA